MKLSKRRLIVVSSAITAGLILGLLGSGCGTFSRRKQPQAEADAPVVEAGTQATAAHATTASVNTNKGDVTSRAAAEAETAAASSAPPAAASANSPSPEGTVPGVAEALPNASFTTASVTTASGVGAPVGGQSYDEMRQQIEALQSRIETLEGRVSSRESGDGQVHAKISAMNEKVDSTRASVEHALHLKNGTPGVHPVSGRVSDVRGVSIDPQIPTNTALKDPEAGFTNDGAVKAYRQATILFRGHKYPEANLAFSAFLQLHADHPLAGAAQFQIGECYFRQKEYRLAISEYQRVLSAYDRSSHISQTLKQLAAAEEANGNPDEAKRYRQQLLSLFAQSPAAKGESVATKTPEVTPAAAPVAASPAQAAPIAAAPPASAAASAAAEAATPVAAQAEATADSEAAPAAQAATAPISQASGDLEIVEKAKQQPVSAGAELKKAAALDEAPPTAPLTEPAPGAPAAATKKAEK